MKRKLLCLALSTAVFGCLSEPGGLVTGTDPGGGADGVDAGADDVECAGADKSLYFADNDGDSYGDALTAVEACAAPLGYVTNDQDCNDSEPLAYPGAAEMCGDRINNDCNGSVDACLPNLTAQWSFDDIAGTTASDLSDNGLVGILQGGLLNTANSMLIFDGVDDYVEVAHTPKLELAVGTVSFWFKPSQIGIEQSMLSKDSSGNDAGGHLSFYQQADGTVRARLQSNNESYEILSPTPLPIGQWHHVVLAFGGNEGMRLTVNGVLVGTDPYTGGLLRNLEPLAIGVGTDQSGDLTAQPISKPFAGSIADVQIYDRQLFSDEIIQLGTVSAPPAGL